MATNMTADFFSDDETFLTNHPLPSPAGTPYASLSNRTSRYGTPSSEMTNSPPPFPPEPNMASEDANEDENISVLDPRRFTPTLQASLVSEILNLRRELDSKHKFLEDLETNLHAARNEKDSLNNQLSASTKECRAAKKQLQQLENGTFSALEELAGERDKVRDANADLREKLSSAQKSLRSQQEDSARVHDMWARDKEAWGDDKRALERRVHVSESRLKIVLDELAMQEAAHEAAAFDSDAEDLPRDSGVGHESDTASVRSSPQRRSSTRLARHSRNPSNGSFRSIGRPYRMSLMSANGSEVHAKSNGLTLADELVFDEEEEDLDDLELDSDDFPENEMRARRALESRQSMRQDEKAKRILGLSLDLNQPSKDGPITAIERETAEGTDMPAKSPTRSSNRSPIRASAHRVSREVQLIFPPYKPQYVDTGVQPSPPASKVDFSAVGPHVAPLQKADDNIPTIAEVEANQSRKRVSALSHTSANSPHQQPIAAPRLMTSTSSQTLESPLSPPATPKVDTPAPELPLTPLPRPEAVSISTQTDFVEEVKPALPSPTRAAPPPPVTIPSIAIHAPSSAPSSPKDPILPPGTKTVSTQTSLDLASSMRSSGMQTEPIRIDQRQIKLPAHLLPSAISSKPGTPEPTQRGTPTTMPSTTSPSAHDHQEYEQRSSATPARQNLVSLLEKAANKTVEDRYPGNNDNGPLAHYRDQGSDISRPFRSSSLFAGFDGPPSDEEDREIGLSEDEQFGPVYITPLPASRTVKNGHVFTKVPSPVPEEGEIHAASEDLEDSTASNKISSDRSSLERPSKVSKPVRNSLSRQSSIRRASGIQTGSLRRARSRSPSLGSSTSSGPVPRPPFPVPTRSSSRKPVISKSEGSQSPTPRSGNNPAGRRPYGVRGHQRKDSLRKVRSAAVIPKSARPRSRSPPLPVVPAIPSSPQWPPLPNDIVMGHKLGHRHQLSTTTTHTGTGSVGSAGYQASVVDAIAAAMVGEWMWKYVRKRKTFGGPESPALEETAVLTSSGVRHKRWVWISPYERSVLWSNKQPVTSAALIGKSGRKLMIQSVLDVADNSPIPKSAGTEEIFNRSILILTPARALKFTATSRERHYLWLTALSFLAQSNAAVPDMNAVPPTPPPEEIKYKPSGATLRRSHVRDSVRLAKDKANPVMQRYASQAEPMPDLCATSTYSKAIAVAASPPAIPRGPIHGRKRSHTGPSAPPPGMPFRSFSHQNVPSLYSTGSSDMYNMQPPSVPSSVYNPQSSVMSTRTSEASTSTRQHFFDSMGTVRMEAFIDNSLNEKSAPPKPRMRLRRNSQWSNSTNDAQRSGGLHEDFTYENPDPFRGF